ncbi:MAG: hypothetical protein ACXVFM_05725 [Solirubrobacteraceae bacterium]
MAIDAAGTAYIGWQVNTNADAGDSVQLCVLPKGARACASLATIAFPGSGLGNGQVSVLLPAPGIVEVAVARNLLNVFGYYLGTVEHRGRWSLLVDLRRAKAKRTATVRLVPRHGRARTLRLPVLGCGRVA